VSTGDPGEEKEALDELAVYADYAAMGRPVPVIARPGATARLTVTRIKRKDEPE
jgi:hypothetical protein